MLEEEYVTNIVTNTPSQFMGRVLTQWLSAHCSIFIVPLVICGALAVFRYEWIIVGLALMLLFYPFILFMAYFKVGLRPEVADFIRPFQIRLTESGLEFRIFSLIKSADDDTKEAAENVYNPVGTYFFSFNDLKKVEIGRRSITFYLKKPKYASLTIFDNSWRYDQEINRLKMHVSKLCGEAGVKMA